jgi:hypothetical protein
MLNYLFGFKMIRQFTILSLLLVSFLCTGYSNTYKINGVVYNGAKLNVYPGIENIFIIESDSHNLGNAATESSKFTIQSSYVAPTVTNSGTNDNSAPGSITTGGGSTSFTAGNKLKVGIIAKSGTRLGTVETIKIMPILSSTKNPAPVFTFDIVYSANPEISLIEFVNSNIQAIKSGEAFKIRIKGSNLDDIILKLPKQVSGKIIKNNGKEMLLELTAGKSFKGLTIDNNFFDVSQAKAEIKFSAKSLIVK